MVDILSAEIADLSAKKSELQSQYAGSTNIQERQDIIDAINKIEKKLTELRTQQQTDEQQHEERMEQAQERINTAFDEVEYDGEKYPIRLFTKDETAAQVLRIHFTNIHLSQENENSKRVMELKASYEVDKEQLRDELKESRELVQALKEQLAQAVMEKEDLEQKRDAAVRMADEAIKAKEAAELFADEKQQHIDKLREEQAIGASAAARVVTNLDGNIGDLMKKWKEERPAIYDVQPTDHLRKVEFTAKLAETDETITDKYIYIQKYRVIDEAEAGRFRLEREAAKAAEQVVEPSTEVETDTSLVTPPPLFPTQGQGNGDGLAEEASSVAGSTVSRQEFEELSARVARLEQQKANAAA